MNIQMILKNSSLINNDNNILFGDEFKCGDLKFKQYFRINEHSSGQVEAGIRLLTPILILPWAVVVDNLTT